MGLVHWRAVPSQSEYGSLQAGLSLSPSLERFARGHTGMPGPQHFTMSGYYRGFRVNGGGRRKHLGRTSEARPVEEFIPEGLKLTRRHSWRLDQGLLDAAAIDCTNDVSVELSALSRGWSRMQQNGRLRVRGPSRIIGGGAGWHSGTYKPRDGPWQ